MKGFHELSLVALSFLAYAVSAEELEDPKLSESDVHVLTQDTFDAFVQERPYVLAEFYAPWCGHCKMLAPEYEKAATTLKDKNPDISLAKIDCHDETNSDLCRQEGIAGFPTLKVYRKDMPGVSKSYSGARESDAIAEFMLKQTEDAVKIIDHDNHDKITTTHKVVMVAYFAEDDTESRATFAQVAESLRDNFAFASTSHAHHAESADVKFPSIVLYKQYDEPKVVYPHDTIEVEKVTEFIKVASTPLVGEVGHETYSDYMDAGIPLAYIFVVGDDEKQKYSKMVKPLAEKYKGKINFATIDAALYGAHAPNLNLKKESWPAFAIQDTVKNLKYPFDQEKNLTVEDLTKFVDDFAEGKIEPTFKSEPIPEKQEGPVHVVVANNFDDLVVNNDKDVLVEFYIPHCGACKNLAPQYEKLAKLYFDNPEYSEKVVIAKFDCTANDPPSSIEITGFPTLKLYRAGAKDKPIDYDGDRSVGDMAKFVKESGKHSVDAYVAPPAEEAEELENSEHEDLLNRLADMAVDDEVVEEAAKKTKETTEEPSPEAAKEVHDEL